MQDAQILREAGFRIEMLGVPGGTPNPAYLLWLVRNVRRLLGCNIYFEWFAFPPIVLLAKTFGRPVILNAVGYEVFDSPEIREEWFPTWWFARALISIGLRRADRVIAISSDISRRAARWGARDVSVVYEGIDVDRFAPLIGSERRSNTILSTAFLSRGNVKRKDLPTLIEALRIVRRELPRTKLVLIGRKMDGYPLLLDMIARLDLAGAVEFLGEVDSGKLLEVMSSATVFVMPSLQEGFPTVLCEALCNGLPIVTTNRSTMNEIFTDQSNALLVDAKNPPQLAAAILRVLKDNESARQMTEEGRQMVREKYSKEVRRSKLEGLFFSVPKRTHVFNPFWFIIFAFFSMLSPAVILLQSVVNRDFRKGRMVSVRSTLVGMVRGESPV
jgi:glycosyltransferase involved in cell wall biosynthesis